MKFISLFAGIGGFDLALERLGHECVYANDFNKYAAQIYDRQFSLPGDRSSRFVSGGSESSVQPAGIMSPIKESPIINNPGSSGENSGESEGMETGNKEGSNVKQSNISTEGHISSQNSSDNPLYDATIEQERARGVGTLKQDGSDSLLSGHQQQPSNRIDQRDITTVLTSEIPDHDLLVGGFPCQSFSIAGKRRGFEDTRGTMFFEVARILRDKRPRYLILENVKGLLSHDSGRTFKVIISALVELGYDIQWQVLNSKNFGVPQNRERVYIVGHLRGGSRPEIFPIGYNSQKTTELSGHEVDGAQVSNTLTARYEPAQATGTYIGENPSESERDAQMKIKVVGMLDSEGWEKRNESIRRVYSPDGISPTIPTAQGGGVMAKILQAVKMERTDEAKEIRRESMKNGKDWSPRSGKQLGVRDDELMNTITANWEVNQAVTDGMKIRRLTPTECERLQGFPDGWTKEGLDKDGNIVQMSDSQRYKTLGNAVTTCVVKEIVSHLCNE